MVALLSSKQEPCMQVNEPVCQELQLMADRSVLISKKGTIMSGWNDVVVNKCGNVLVK